MRRLDAPSALPTEPTCGLPPAPNETAPADAAPFDASAPGVSELRLVRDVVVAPHAPLRFAMAQVLWAAAPLAGLLGVESLPRWAAALEAPPAAQPEP